MPLPTNIVRALFVNELLSCGGIKEYLKAGVEFACRVVESQGFAKGVHELPRTPGPNRSFDKPSSILGVAEKLSRELPAKCQEVVYGNIRFAGVVCCTVCR